MCSANRPTLGKDPEVAERSVAHATLVVERIYDAAPARVFAAWAEPELKALWFSEPSADHELDFRIGGREISRDDPPMGRGYTFDARYCDIVVGERIIYTYEMFAGETLTSVSVSTVEFKPEGAGTRVVLTDQTAFLDGHDDPAAREPGWGTLLDALGAYLRTQSPGVGAATGD
jgi:uncharacterized protein YndB with AHSA1/START domain